MFKERVNDMKKTFIKRITRLVVAALSVAICVVTVPASVFAETVSDENQISIIKDYDFSYEEELGKCREIMSVPIDTNSAPTMIEETSYITRDAGYPHKFHDLSSSEYRYKGGADDLKLYTLTYYKPTSDGTIYLEGWGQTKYSINGMAQNLVIDIYDQKTRECLASFPLDADNILERTSDHTYFYYRFAIIYLNPEKNYFIGFRGDIPAFSINVEGYIAHHWTKHYNY